MNYQGFKLKDKRHGLEVQLPPYLVVLRGTAGTARLPRVPLQRVHPGIRLAGAAEELTSLVPTDGTHRVQAGRGGVGVRDAAADVSGVLVCLLVATEVRFAQCRWPKPADITFRYAIFASAKCGACGDGGGGSGDRVHSAIFWLTSDVLSSEG